MNTARENEGVKRVSLDAGAGSHLEMVLAEGAGEGPTLAILGGVHGDEPEGSLAIEILLAGLTRSSLMGTVRAVPVSNPGATEADSRVTPADGLNLAREFPGLPEGHPTQRLAYLITRHVISGADLLIDLHSAGRDYVMPYFAGFDASREWSATSARAAAAFGAPLIWEHNKVAPGRSISAAADLSVPAIYVEATGGGTVSGSTIDGLLAGLKRVMAEFGLLEPTEAASAPAAILRGGDGNVDESVTCTTDGVCVTRVAAGEIVESGDAIVDIYQQGNVAEYVRAPRRGTVMMLRKNPRVVAGQAIAMLGPIPRADR